MKVLRTIISMSCMMLFAASALALEPGEVLVVANSKVPQSVELAKHYAVVRGIPDENIILLETADTYQIQREAYEREILQPLRDALIARTQSSPIRCICLMWGVPVRVSQPKEKPDELATLIRIEAERSHNRLAAARELLRKVGQEFPEQANTNSLNLADLFETPLPPAPEYLLSLRQLQADIEKQLELKGALAMTLSDADQRTIAIRQMMALQLEINGLRGLIPFVEQIYRDKIDQAGLAAYKEALDEANQTLIELVDAEKSVENTNATLVAMQRAGGVLLVANYTAEQKNAIGPAQSLSADASVDSELALIWADTESYAGWVPNPLLWRAEPASDSSTQMPIIMTARIDGPSAEDARNIIDSSLAAEQTGLSGKFYVDAGLATSLSNRDKGGTFARYDRHLRSLGQAIRLNTDLDVIIDTNPEVMASGTAPDAALYIGWYSLEEYVPAFTWQAGAVAYHVASYEAKKLRDPNSNEWCPKLIQNGVAATIGAVNEPRLDHFPDDAQFFLLLLTGQYTIAECYWRTVPAASWQMTLIADPLYTPFKVNPKIAKAELPPGITPPDNWPPVYQRMEVQQPNASEALLHVADPAGKQNPPAPND